MIDATNWPLWQQMAMLLGVVVIVVVMGAKLMVYFAKRKLKRTLLKPFKLFGKAKIISKGGISLTTKTFSKLVPIVKDAYNHPETQEWVKKGTTIVQKEYKELKKDPKKYYKENKHKKPIEYIKGLKPEKQVKKALKTLKKPNKPTKGRV